MIVHTSPLRSFPTRRSLVERARAGRGPLIAYAVLIAVLVAGAAVIDHLDAVVFVALVALWWALPALRARGGAR